MSVENFSRQKIISANKIFLENHFSKWNNPKRLHILHVDDIVTYAAEIKHKKWQKKEYGT
jgi:hypothetical protein